MKINTPYPEKTNTPYWKYGMNIIFWKISSVVATPRNSNTPRHFKSLSLDELRSPNFNLFSDQEYSKEEEAEAMAETMEQYMGKTRTDYGSGVARPKIEEKDSFELKGQFLKELRENTFSGSDNKDANEHIEKVLKIVDLFHVPNITVDQLMLRVFPISLTGAASRWLRNEPTGSIKTWEDLKTKFLNKYCPPGRTAKKIEEINNFQQEPDETLYQAWEHFKELLMKCPQHYLTEMQEVILFYNGLDVPTRQILDSRGVVPTKTAADAKKAIQEMAEYSQKWHNGTSRGRRCEQCKGPHYTKDCPLKEEGKTLEEAYYTQFGGPFQGGGYRATALGFYQRNNANPSREDLEVYLARLKRTQEIKSSQSRLLLKLIHTRYAVLDLLNTPFPLDRTVHSSYSKASHIDESIPQKEKDPGSFTLPSFINNVCFDNALVDLGASISVMPLLTYLNLGLGELAYTKLTVELADRTVKYPKELLEKINFELNDLNEPFELRRNQGDDLMPTVEEGEDMDAYRDEGMGDVIVGEPFLRGKDVLRLSQSV
ncbi:hypothetical protein Tco_1343279 [Tanacetum coccineum]